MTPFISPRRYSLTRPTQPCGVLRPNETPPNGEEPSAARESSQGQTTMSPRCTAAPITPSPARPRNPLGDKRDGSLPLKTIGREEPFSSTPYRIPLSHRIRVTGRLLYMYVTVHVLHYCICAHYHAQILESYHCPLRGYGVTHRYRQH